MQFIREDGTSFQMNLLGYAEPHARAYGRANLLRQRVVVTGPSGAWQSEFAGLTTYEAGWLADWLEQAAGGCEIRQRLDFLEPSLSFSLVEQAGGRVLRIFLEWQARPTWMFSSSGGTHDLWLDFPLSDPAALTRAATQLRRELARHPERRGLNLAGQSLRQVYPAYGV